MIGKFLRSDRGPAESDALRFVIDSQWALYGHVILTGWTLASLRLASVSIDGMERDFQQGENVRQDVIDSQGADFGGFVLVVDLASSAITGSRAELSCRTENGEVINRRLSLPEFSEESLAAVREHTAARHYRCNLLRSLLFDELTSGQSNIDHVETFRGGGLVISGWVLDAQGSEIFLTDGRRRALVPLEANSIELRPDATAHLRTLGHATETDCHGFSAFTLMPFDVATIQLIARRANKVSLGFETDVLHGARIQKKLVDTLALLSRDRLPMDTTLDTIETVVRNEVVAAPRTANNVVYTICAGDQPICVSNVVPFFGDEFFLVDQIMMQADSPRDMEWVFVCDDARLITAMTDILNSRLSQICRRTVLVINDENLGFAGACNVGAIHATGEFLLFMNSDVYVADFSMIDAAVDHLRANDTVGLCGFSLTYEDHSIQHDGMEFQTHSAFRGLWVCNHPRKGTPAVWAEGEIDIVPAEIVTGALMLMRADTMPAHEVFSDEFIIGDYEDADLCLRLRDMGLSIVLVRGTGIFHFERQSFAHLGNLGGRQALSYMNCRILNRRWGARLDGGEFRFQ